MGTMMKRIVLFLAVNALVIFTISIILNLLHVQPYLTKNGLDYQSLMIFCLIWGMAGAFISLGLSRIMAKWMMGVVVIDPRNATVQESKLLDMVYSLARNAGLPNVPEVGIYQSPEVNAFATGPTRSRALVAVSSGLLNRMNGSEVEAVLAHEISHVSNGDMVTMTLLQGIINAFVMFFARILAYVVMRLGKRDEESLGSPFMYTILVFVFEVFFMVLGSIVVAAFSRYREFRADAGGARLVGRDKMIGALQALERVSAVRDPQVDQPSFQAFKISSSKSVMFRLFASHPPLEERIARLARG